MIKIISVILILVSSFASIYYSVGGVTKPETLSPYPKAGMPRLAIQLLSLALGIGGLLLLFPKTFLLGGALLIMHSLVTVICYIILKEWKAGFSEFLLMLIPAFVLWAGYPLLALNEKNNVALLNAELQLAYLGENKNQSKSNALKQHTTKRLSQNGRKVFQKNIFAQSNVQLNTVEKDLKFSADSKGSEAEIIKEVECSYSYAAYGIRNLGNSYQKQNKQEITRENNGNESCRFNSIINFCNKKRYARLVKGKRRPLPVLRKLKHFFI